MNGLKELLVGEEKRLMEIKNIVDPRLVNVPEGSLRITKSNNCTQFRYSTVESKKEIYIPKKDMMLVNALAQKTYDRKIKKIVDKRLKQIGKLSKEYEDDEIEKIYTELNPVRQALVQAVEMPWEQRIEEWKSIKYIGKEFSDNTPEIYTKKGERVRSKSEKILADTFYDFGIEYKYECPLDLKGYGVVYPDFTILRKRDRREVYWEHDGRMDDPTYVEKAIKKINTYINNDIFLGDNLILSFETMSTVINDKVIKQMITNYLL